MGSQSVAGVLLLILFSTSYSLTGDGKRVKSEKTPSAISFSFCDADERTGTVKFKIKVRNKQGKVVSVRFRGEVHGELGAGKTRTVNADGKIEQNNVKYLKVNSARNICFQALVFDTIIMVDQPTFFNESCKDNAENVLPCRKLKSKVWPPSICQSALTKLLKKKGVIENVPKEKPGPRSFKTPTYDISNDMSQASFAIADGLASEFRKLVKHRINVVRYNKPDNFGKIISKLGKFSTFLSSLSPIISIFSGVTSIITSFLTPNPFDEMIKYLKQEFDEVHRRLTHIQDDIVELTRVVEAQSKVVAMESAFKRIRYSLRRYQYMVNSLSNAPVCGLKYLLKRREVAEFMRYYETEHVEDALRDLFGADFGLVPEAPSLLKSHMRGYCGSNPARVRRFMEEVSVYTYAGSLAHFAFKDLDCRRRRIKNCDKDGKEKEEWMKSLHRLLDLASILKEAAVNPLQGLRMDMGKQLDTLIRGEVVSHFSAGKNVSLDGGKRFDQFPGLIDKVYNFVVGKLYSKDDWPEACIINLKADRVVIIEVAQLLENVLVYGTNFKPWALRYDKTRYGVEKQKYKVKHAPRGSRDQLLGYVAKEVKCDCVDGGPNIPECSLYSFYPGFHTDPLNSTMLPSQMLYFMFNPYSYLMEMAMTAVSNFDAFVIPLFIQPTAKVIINMIPISVRYVENLPPLSCMSFFVRGSKKYDTRVLAGCYRYEVLEGKSYECQVPDWTDPNRKTPDWEQHTVIII